MSRRDHHLLLVAAAEMSVVCTPLEPVIFLGRLYYCKLISQKFIHSCWEFLHNCRSIDSKRPFHILWIMFDTSLKIGWEELFATASWVERAGRTLTRSMISHHWIFFSNAFGIVGIGQLQWVPALWFLQAATAHLPTNRAPAPEGYLGSLSYVKVVLVVTPYIVEHMGLAWLHIHAGSRIIRNVPCCSAALSYKVGTCLL